MTASARLIAVVDDDPGVCRALERLLRSLGFAVATFPSGEALLAAVAARPPDDVLLDLHLPGLRGPDLVAALAERGIAVVVMTGLDRPGSREACLGAGAAAYVTKPVSLDDLVRLLGPVPDPAPG